jgi:hypothetical protein
MTCRHVSELPAMPCTSSSRVLTERLAALGLKPHIHIARTLPTASLPERAARVVEAIDATAQRGGAN